ncbi:MAG TPA: hypothetical protein VFU22_30730, partial [Roseiflexaceae bacterium]|nr:hypothetical protein [Roseiflexaceae bacterium]
VLEFGISADHPPLEVAQRTESADVPIVITTLRYRSATLELTTFGHRHDGDRRTDIVLWSIRAADDSDAPLTGLRVDAFERGRIFTLPSQNHANSIFALAPDALPHHGGPDLILAQGQSPATADPGSLAFVSVPHPLQTTHTIGFRPTSAFAIEPQILRAGETISGAILVPLNHEQIEGIDLAWAQAAADQERLFWQGFRESRLAIEIPDDAVMDMIASSARNIMQAREVKDGLPVFQVGATIYRGLWVVDGHFMLECAHYLGYRDEVAGALERLLKSAGADGSIAEMPFHTKETAIALTTIVRQCELMGDDERLRRHWDIVRNGAEYIERLRAEAAGLPAESPAHGLMPPSFADGGAGGKRPEYTTALWTLVGLKTVAQAAQRLGYAEDAARFTADYEALMADFRRCAARDMQRLTDGTPYLPMVMPGSGEHINLPDTPATPGQVLRPYQLQPATATWAFCQAIWPGEVFGPADDFVVNLLRLLDQLDDEEGMPAETGWLPYRSLWNYYASFAAHAWLYAGKPEKAIDYLYAFANHAAPTRVWREEQSLSSTGNGQLCGDMPHNWASAEFIRLVRHLLVFEVGDTLHVLPGLPAEWRVPGKTLRLERTPTRFGPITLEVSFAEDGGCRATVTRDTSWPIQPATVVLHAERLDGGALRLDQQPATREPDGTVRLPQSTSITIEVAPAQ